MRMEIDRVDINSIDYDTFVEKYLLPEKLVVLTGIDVTSHASLSPQNIKERFAKDDMKRAGWFDVNMTQDEEMMVPEIVRQILDRDDMCVREAPMRVFMQPGGHKTLPHYDGNSLHGLNLQVAGKKKWILTSPKTPLPFMPFMFAAMVKPEFDYPDDKYDVYEFETNPGDMLFLARYTCHEVHSLCDININFNWVFTPDAPNESSPLGKREVEIVKLRKSMPWVNSVFFPDDFTKYGGQGEALIKRYSHDVGALRTFGRFMSELVKFPLLPFYAKGLKKQAGDFDKNNFNV